MQKVKRGNLANGHVRAAAVLVVVSCSTGPREHGETIDFRSDPPPSVEDLFGGVAHASPRDASVASTASEAVMPENPSHIAIRFPKVPEVQVVSLTGEPYPYPYSVAEEGESTVVTLYLPQGVRAGIRARAVVAARQLEYGEAPTSETDFMRFDAKGPESAFTDAQVISGTGTVKQYDVPDENTTVPPSGEEKSGLETSIEERYYQGGAYNNNYRPRILEIDTQDNTNPFVTLDLIANIENIVAVDMADTTKERGRWINDGGTGPGSVQVDSANDQASVNATKIQDYTVGGHQVHFYFEDEFGNRTGLSQPAVLVGPNLVLSQEEIYNMGSASVALTTCGNGIVDAGEQCDDADDVDYNECSNECKLTHNLIHTDFGGGSPSLEPDFILPPDNLQFDFANANPNTMGLTVTPSTGFLKYKNTLYPDMQKGSVEFVVDGAVLNNYSGSEDVYLFDTQLGGDPNDPDHSINIVLRGVVGVLDFKVQGGSGSYYLVERISNPSAIPNGQVTLRASWDLMQSAQEDRLKLVVLENDVEKVNGSDATPGSMSSFAPNPNSTIDDYPLFIGSRSGGYDNSQYPGTIASFSLKSE